VKRKGGGAASGKGRKTGFTRRGFGRGTQGGSGWEGNTGAEKPPTEKKGLMLSRVSKSFLLCRVGEGYRSRHGFTAKRNEQKRIRLVSGGRRKSGHNTLIRGFSERGHKTFQCLKEKKRGLMETGEEFGEKLPTKRKEKSLTYKKKKRGARS